MEALQLLQSLRACIFNFSLDIFEFVVLLQNGVMQRVFSLAIGLSSKFNVRLQLLILLFEQFSFLRELSNLCVYFSNLLFKRINLRIVLKHNLLCFFL